MVYSFFSETWTAPFIQNALMTVRHKFPDKHPQSKSPTDKILTSDRVTFHLPWGAVGFCQTELQKGVMSGGFMSGCSINLTYWLTLHAHRQSTTTPQFLYQNLLRATHYTFKIIHCQKIQVNAYLTAIIVVLRAYCMLISYVTSSQHAQNNVYTCLKQADKSAKDC